MYHFSLYTLERSTVFDSVLYNLPSFLLLSYWSHESHRFAISQILRLEFLGVQVMSEIINQCQLTYWEKMTMDKNVTQFHDNIGSCERLFKTPIPVAYTRLTSRVLMLWHMVLPFALWSACGWLTIPVTCMSSAALFYIEEVGVLIEEPFWILALTSISAGIVSSVDGLSAAHKEAQLLLTWDSTFEPSSKPDHVVINFDRSKSHGIREGNVNIVLSRMKSVCWSCTIGYL